MTAAWGPDDETEREGVHRRRPSVERAAMPGDAGGGGVRGSHLVHRVDQTPRCRQPLVPVDPAHVEVAPVLDGKPRPLRLILTTAERGKARNEREPISHLRKTASTTLP
jgi:hypothetical protein